MTSTSGPRNPAGCVWCTSRIAWSCELIGTQIHICTARPWLRDQTSPNPPPQASLPPASPVSSDRRMALQYLADSNGWLSFAHSTPTLYVTAEDEDFDVETLRAWRDEGFHVKYVPMGKGGKTYVSTLHQLGDGMGIGERYAIVGTAPSSPLEAPAATPLRVHVAPGLVDRRICHTALTPRS